MDLTSLTQHLTASNSTKISLRWKGLCLFKYWKALVQTQMYVFEASWWSEGCAAVVLIPELIRLRNVTKLSAVRPGSLASLGIIIRDHLIIITLKLNSDNCRVLSWLMDWAWHLLPRQPWTVRLPPGWTCRDISRINDRKWIWYGSDGHQLDDYPPCEEWRN